MGRVKCQESQRRGLVKKQDTPVRMAPSARSSVVRKRLLTNTRCEALPEEPEGEQIDVKASNPVLTKPVNCKLMRSPAFPKIPRGEAILPAGVANKRPCPHVSPAGHPTIRVTPDSEGFKGGEEEQTVTGIRGTSFSMASDMTYSTDDDDDDDDNNEEEEDCYSSTTSSSLPSPEIFRRESNVKNSTLLDVSHAENIDMHHPSKFNFFDISVILPENNSEIEGPGAETKRHADLFNSDKPIKLKTPPEPSKRKPILYKKKVWFKSPMIAETLEGKRIPSIKLPLCNTCEPVQTSRPAEQVKPGTEASRAREINTKEQPLQKRCQQTAKFFDFADDHEEELFFLKMRERHVKLSNGALFPLPAV